MSRVPPSEEVAREEIVAALPRMYEGFFLLHLTLAKAQDEAEEKGEDWSPECEFLLVKMNELSEAIRIIHRKDGTYPRRFRFKGGKAV